VAGNDVPTLTGRVTGMAEKSGFLPCVLRFTVVTVCADPNLTDSIKTKQAAKKSPIRKREKTPDVRENPEGDGVKKSFIFIE
jgi:hypothetical protein